MLLADQVQSAYEHLYDLVYLRTHPLVDLLVADERARPHDRAWQLHHILIEAVAELDPGPDAPVFSREWRRHRIMVMRYLDGSEPQEVADEIGIGVRHYYREQHAAITAMADVLWDRYHVSNAHPPEPMPSAEADTRLSRLEMMRLEAARLANISRYADLSETVSGVISVLGDLLTERRLVVRQDIPVSLPRYAHDQNLLRQLLLGLLGYLIERSERASIHFFARESGDHIPLSLRVDSEQTERTSLGSPDLNRLDEFAELARAAQVNLTPVVERTVVGFDLELTSAAHNLVLVVDDNELIIELIRRYLVPRGYEVASAPSADRALELAEQMHPFAMTVDLMMPDRDGWDLLKALLQRPTTRDIPVIVCSVLRQKELALSLGATAFLEKPVKEDELLAVLTALDSP